MSLASIFSPARGSRTLPSGGEPNHPPMETIPGVEAICVQLQRMDQGYRGLLADIEEHSVSEMKAASLIRRTAEALANVAVVEGEGEGDWGVWSGFGSTMLELSLAKMSRYKTRATATAAVARQQDLWDDGGALWTPAFAQCTVIKEFLDGVLARAIAARSQYRSSLAEASQQVSRLQHLQEALARAPRANKEALHQAVVTQRVALRATQHKVAMDRVELVHRYARALHSKGAMAVELKNTLLAEQDSETDGAHHITTAARAAGGRGFRQRFQLHRRESVKGEPPVLVSVYTNTALAAEDFGTGHSCPAIRLNGVASQPSREFGSVIADHASGQRAQLCGERGQGGRVCAGRGGVRNSTCEDEEAAASFREGVGWGGGGEEEGEGFSEANVGAGSMPSICLCPISGQVMRDPVSPGGIR